MKATTEKAFEAYIQETMSARGWISGSNQTWDKNTALFPDQVIAFIKDTQADLWAQDGVLLDCFNPLKQLEEKDYLEILINAKAHDAIRERLDLYGVFDKQLFPDLDGMAKWLKFHEFECQNGDIL